MVKVSEQIIVIQKYQKILLYLEISKDLAKKFHIITSQITFILQNLLKDPFIQIFFRLFNKALILAICYVSYCIGNFMSFLIWDFTHFLHNYPGIVSKQNFTGALLFLQYLDFCRVIKDIKVYTFYYDFQCPL